MNLLQHSLAKSIKEHNQAPGYGSLVRFLDGGVAATTAVALGGFIQISYNRCSLLGRDPPAAARGGPSGRTEGEQGVDRYSRSVKEKQIRPARTDRSALSPSVCLLLKRVTLLNVLTPPVALVRPARATSSATAAARAPTARRPTKPQPRVSFG